MNDNPFAAGPGMWITQNVRTCPICQRRYTDADYTIEVRYYDEVKTLDEVCPECMKRLGFSEPKKTITQSKLDTLMSNIRYLKGLHNNKEDIGGEK